jgi:hypothetical protein
VNTKNYTVLILSVVYCYSSGTKSVFGSGCFLKCFSLENASK